jgi:hypothetical protein
MNLIIYLGYIYDLNLEGMNLGDKCLLLCRSLSKNTSLLTLHLSYNFISDSAIEKLKWFLNIYQEDIVND